MADVRLERKEIVFRNITYILTYVKFIGTISNNSYFAGCALGYSCYRFDANLWTARPWFADITNGLCENHCKDDAANYAYSGTSVRFLCLKFNHKVFVYVPDTCFLFSTGFNSIVSLTIRKRESA